MTLEKKLTRRQKKLSQKSHVNNNVIEFKTLNLEQIKPLTKNQSTAFRSWYDGYNLLLTGSAGTGKTFCGLYLALDELLYNKNDIDKIVIFRTAEPSKDIGFLPGSIKEKIKVYEAAYESICSELFGRGDAYSILKQKAKIEFQPTSFIRGLTYNDSIVIVDEVQSMTWHEIYTIMTRIGKNTKIIFCGDVKQNDLVMNKHRLESGISKLTSVLNNMDQFKVIKFNHDDIVRSDLIKSWIVECDRLGI